MAIFAMLVATLAVVGCGGVEPQQRTIDLKITNGEFNLDPPVVKVNQDDDVTLRFVKYESEEADPICAQRVLFLHSAWRTEFERSYIAR